MRVFAIEVPDDGAWLVGTDAWSLDRLDEVGRGIVLSWHDVWATVDHTYETSHGSRQMPWLNGGALALPDQNNGLSDFLFDFGDLLPVSTPDGTFWVFNADTVISGALDSSSRFEYVPGTDRIMDVKAWGFDSAAISDYQIFRVVEIPSYLLLTESAVKAVRDFGIKGPTFREVWEG